MLSGTALKIERNVGNGAFVVGEGGIL